MPTGRPLPQKPISSEEVWDAFQEFMCEDEREAKLLIQELEVAQEEAQQGMPSKSMTTHALAPGRGAAPHRSRKPPARPVC